MDSRLSAKVVSLFLVFSICSFGFVSMNTWADVTPTDGQIAIEKTIQINQSENVRVFFTGFTGVDDWYGSSFSLTSQGTSVNDGTRIGVTSAVECNLNLTTWNVLPENTAGTVATFSLWSATGWSAFTFLIDNLHAGVWYNVYIDGILGPSKLVGTPITWGFAGTSGTHTFEVRQSAINASNTSLITAIFIFLLLGVALGPIMWTIKLSKQKGKVPSTTEIIHLAIYIIVGLTLISAAWLVVG